MWPFKSNPSVSVTEAAQKTQAPNAVFIDVRSSAEFSSGHAKGARNIPLGEITSTRIEELKNASEVYLICQSGGRSSMATSKLLSAGVNAINVAGGTSAWRAAGLPIV